MSAPTLAAPDREIEVLGRTQHGASRAEILAHLSHASTQVRRRAIQTVQAAGLGHIGGEFSVTDILVNLYLHSMNLTPEQIIEGDSERDRFILSKGHTANALYTVLAAGGFIEPADLRTFVQDGSMLNGHPARTKLAAVEASTGPLGHGLPIAVGTALAAKLDGSTRRTFVVLGDGEMQEGSNWEALMSAAHYQLDHLVAVVDRNRLQQGERVASTNDLEPLPEKLAAFGWKVLQVSAHDHGELVDAFQAPAASGRPTAIIAHSEKGFPISYMRDQVAWHHKVPTPEQLATALSELEDQ